MNVVIVGSGRTGSTLTNALASSGHSVTVIDIDAASASSLRVDYDGPGRVTVVEGDGTRDSVLEQASIRDADMFASLTGEDSVNGLAALKAKIKYRVMTVIATVWSGDLSSVFESHGVACVNPAMLSTESVMANIPQVLQEQPSGPPTDAGGE